MRHVVIGSLWLVAALQVPRATLAQDAANQAALQRGPAFFLAGASKDGPIRLDVKRTPVLSRRITLDLRDVSLEEALTKITHEAGLKLVYSKAKVPIDKRVTIRAEDITVAGALSDVLFDVDVDVMFSASAQAMLVPRSETAAMATIEAVGVVSGRVIDSISGEGVARAQVTVAGLSLGASTDGSGRFTIPNVPAGDHQLTVRRVGFAPQTRRVAVQDGGTVTVDFLLTRVATALEAVVSTVTGQQRRVELGHVVGRVAADSIVREAPVANLTDLLSARVPGVMVNQQTGKTGAVATIRIRGLNSFTLSNAPLVILDGARVESSYGSDNFLYGLATGRLADFNPNEIESIEIAKGPSAATLYGTDAANGVILIRTKRGQAGRPRWSVTSEQGMITMPYQHLFGDNYYAWGRSVTTGAAMACPLAILATGSCVQDSITHRNALRDPDTTPFGTGRRTQTGLQVSGGVAQFGYFLSGDVMREQGFIKLPESEQRWISERLAGAAIPRDKVYPNVQQRVSFRGNGDIRFGERGDISISNSLQRSNLEDVGTGVVMNEAVFALGRLDNFGGWAFAFRPAYVLNMENVEELTRSINTVTGNWRPSNRLTTRATVGVDFSDVFLDVFDAPGVDIGYNPTGRRINTNISTSQLSADLGGTITGNLTPALTSSLSVGTQYSSRVNKLAELNGVGLLPGAQTIAGASVLTGRESRTESIVAGGYVEGGLTWRDRLFLKGAVRGDGASSFGRGFNTAVYPKLSASWLASEEPWMPRPTWLSSLRLRSAFGFAGAQPPATAGFATVVTGSAVINGASSNAVFSGNIGNQDIRPERQRELEYGAEVDLFNHRATLEATGYNKVSSDAIVSQPFAASAGGGSQFINIGSVRNRGVELMFTGRLLQGGPTTLELNLNGSVNHNTLLSAGPDFVPTTPTPFGPYRNAVGYPLNGLWQRPITSYADANGNGILEVAEVMVGDTAIYMGPSSPTKQFTLSGTLGLWSDRLRVSSIVDWRGGNMVWDYNTYGRCGVLDLCSTSNIPGAPLDVQASRVAGGGRSSIGYFVNGAFTRWRELSVTGRMPAAVARVVRAREAGLTLAGRNLALWKPKSQLLDPELNAVVGSDIEYHTSTGLPPSRIWLLRVALSY